MDTGLFPQETYEVNFVISARDRDRVVKRLHREGFVELRDVTRDTPLGAVVERARSPEITSRYDGMLSRLNYALNVFKKAAPRSKGGGLKDLISKKTDSRIPVTPSPPEEALREAEELMEKIEGTLRALDRRLSAVNQSIENLRDRLEAIKIVHSLGFDLSHIRKSEYTAMVVGITSEPERVEEALSPFLVVYGITPLPGDEGKKQGQHVMAVLFLRREEERVMSALRSTGFSPIQLKNVGGFPEEAAERVRKAMENLLSTREEVVEEIKRLKKEYFRSIIRLKEEIELEAERLHAVSLFGATDETLVLSTWCPEENLRGLREALVEETGGAVVVEASAGGKNAPTAMKNPVWARPFEMLTTLFGAPGHDEIDPTRIIGPAFVFLFGIMLGDALYGVIITAVALLLYRGSGRNLSMKNFSIILTLSGVSTIIFGALQGGYFGPDLDTQPNIISTLGLHPPVLMDPMTNPIPVLVLSLVIGLVYINIALLLSAVQKLYFRKYRAFMCEVVPWWLLQPAAFVLLGGNLFGWWTFPQYMTNVAIALTLFGILLLAVDKKGLFFFELTGFVGNFLSFARLLALGLATAGIALTVNVIVGLIAGASISLPLTASVPLGVLGIVLAGMGWVAKNKTQTMIGLLLAAFGFLSAAGLSPVFFVSVAAVGYIFGHLANCGLQTLGAFVHSLRLQYVEFFGYFYEGKGRLFSPFVEKRRNTVIVEKDGR